MKTKRIDFPGSQNQTLSARLELPLGQRPKAFAVFAHCFTCTKNLNAVTHISRGLTQKGLAVFRFDFTGLGQSGGDFANTNFSSNIQDLLAACSFLEAHFEAPSLLVGHSLGGAAVIHAAAQLNYVEAVATIGAPADPEHVTHLIADKREELEQKGEAEVKIAGRPFRIKKQFLDDLQGKSLSTIADELRGKSFLMLHSPQDEVVNISNARSIYEQLLHPKSFVSLNGADHLLSKTKDALYTGSVIGQWAERYLSFDAQPLLSTENQVAARTPIESFTTEMVSGSHRFIADEPKKVGGDDLVPSPYDLLASALAACTAMTIRMYANHKNLELQEIEVHVDHEKVHKEDCEEADKPSAKIDVFTRYIQYVGNLTSEEQKKLVEIANKCPVHRTLHSDIEVKTTLGS